MGQERHLEFWSARSEASRQRLRTLRPSPILECRFDASSADPRKGPIGGTLGTVRDIFAPGIGPDRVDRLPNDLELSGGINPADHDRLRKVVIGVHDFL